MIKHHIPIQVDNLSPRTGNNIIKREIYTNILYYRSECGFNFQTKKCVYHVQYDHLCMNSVLI